MSTKSQGEDTKKRTGQNSKHHQAVHLLASHNAKRAGKPHWKRNQKALEKKAATAVGGHVIAKGGGGRKRKDKKPQIPKVCGGMRGPGEKENSNGEKEREKEKTGRGPGHVPGFGSSWAQTRENVSKKINSNGEEKMRRGGR